MPSFKTCTRNLGARELNAASAEDANSGRISWVVIVKGVSVDDSHHVVAAVGPVVEVDDSILQAALFEIPELQSPQRQASHALGVVPLHHGNRPHSIGAMTAVQEPVDPCGIRLQLLKQRKQSTKRPRIRGPNRSKVSRSIVVNSDQDYTKDDMTRRGSKAPLLQGAAICDRFCMSPVAFACGRAACGSGRTCRSCIAFQRKAKCADRIEPIRPSCSSEYARSTSNTVRTAACGHYCLSTDSYGSATIIRTHHMFGLNDRSVKPR